MTRALQLDGEGVLWGVKHSQGIRWCGDEAEARTFMEASVRQDKSRHWEARGKVRLVSRTIGPLTVVLNPYEEKA